MDLAKEVTTAEAYSWTQGSWTLTGGLPEAKKEDELPFHVVAYDFGAKRTSADVADRLSPDHRSGESFLRKMLENESILASSSPIGPGDPAPCDYAITAIQKFLETDIPVSASAPVISCWRWRAVRDCQNEIWSPRRQPSG